MGHSEYRLDCGLNVLYREFIGEDIIMLKCLWYHRGKRSRLFKSHCSGIDSTVQHWPAVSSL